MHIFFSTFRHALHARTTTAAAPACGPAHTARATPSHAHTHAQLASQQAHAHLHIPATTPRSPQYNGPPPCGISARSVRLILGPRSRDDCLPPAYNHRFGAHHYYCRFGAHHYYCRYCRYCSLPQNQPARLERQRAHRSRPQTLARWPPRRPPRARLDAGPERECTSHRCSPALAAIPARRTLIPARLITVTKLALGHATSIPAPTHTNT